MIFRQLARRLAMSCVVIENGSRRLNLLLGFAAIGIRAARVPHSYTLLSFIRRASCHGCSR